jgi:hypothetical protein
VIVNLYQKNASKQQPASSNKAPKGTMQMVMGNPKA